MNTAEIMEVVDEVIAARNELLARGVAPGDVLVITGCALGVRLASGTQR